jgi:putative intracellular protease/amidase/uncharacterized protein (DUF952 family)
VRWLFHVRIKGDGGFLPVGGSAPVSPDELYAPASLANEGFVHASFRDAVSESARLYFAQRPSDALEVLQIDPRRLGVSVEVAATPRGPMPHIVGPIARDAVAAVHPLSAFDENDAAGPLGLGPEGAQRGVPDEVRGTRIALVAFEGMTLLDLVGVYDPLARIAGMGFDPSTRCEIIGAHGGRVWVHDGAELVVERVRPPLEEFDLVVVPGGFGTRSLVHDESLSQWLARYPHNRVLASVCTGALLLGAAGRLKGRRATTHHSALGELGQYGATVVRDRVVHDGPIVSAAGVTSALDLGLYLVRWLLGEDVAKRVADQMEITWWA